MICPRCGKSHNSDTSICLNCGYPMVQSQIGDKNFIIEKPTTGKCVGCLSDLLQFNDNGVGQCLNCGRTFNWMQHIRQSDIPGTNDPMIEDNPFIVRPDEVLPESERKLEVAADSELLDHSINGVSKKYDNTDRIKVKEKLNQDSNLDDKLRYKLLEEKYSAGSISKETYESLRKNLVARIIQQLEDKLLSGIITEQDFIQQKNILEKKIF